MSWTLYNGGGPIAGDLPTSLIGIVCYMGRAVGISYRLGMRPWI